MVLLNPDRRDAIKCKFDVPSAAEASAGLPFLPRRSCYGTMYIDGDDCDDDFPDCLGVREQVLSDIRDLGCEECFFFSSGDVFFGRKDDLRDAISGSHFSASINRDD